MCDYMKQPCQHCPFRNDVKPFLHPNRAAELAYAASNPYSDFPCHKTTVPYEDDDEGGMIRVETSKECAGFLTLRAQMGLDTPKGFEPAYDICYIDDFDMIQAYEDEWNKTHKKLKSK